MKKLQNCARFKKGFKRCKSRGYDFDYLDAGRTAEMILPRGVRMLGDTMERLSAIGAKAELE